MEIRQEVLTSAMTKLKKQQYSELTAEETKTLALYAAAKAAEEAEAEAARVDAITRPIWDKVEVLLKQIDQLLSSPDVIEYLPNHFSPAWNKHRNQDGTIGYQRLMLTSSKNTSPARYSKAEKVEEKSEKVETFSSDVLNRAITIE